MARVILVTGGCRSGKSAFAEQLALSCPGKRRYIATCHVFDEEMAERVRRHKERRKADGWVTLEEECDLAGALALCPAGSSVLVDCLTLWINNLMYRAETENRVFDEDAMNRACDRLEQQLRTMEGTVVFVLNEVGLGVVPENALARRFRDCSGRCGQRIAALAGEVWLTVCGIPVKVKGEK